MVIAKIDGTANDVEAHVEVKGFPTIVLYKKGDPTNPISFSGAREADAMEAWIKEQTA